jgi:hypothetical protein
LLELEDHALQPFGAARLVAERLIKGGEELGPTLGQTAVERPRQEFVQHRIGIEAPHHHPRDVAMQIVAGIADAVADQNTLRPDAGHLARRGSAAAAAAAGASCCRNGIGIAQVEQVEAVVVEGDPCPLPDGESSERQGIAGTLHHQGLLVVQPKTKTLVTVDEGAARLRQPCDDFHVQGTEHLPRIVGFAGNGDAALRTGKPQAHFARQWSDSRRDAITVPRRVIGCNRAPAIFVVTDELHWAGPPKNTAALRRR